MMITIKKYENLKVYQVDATDAYLKKFISKTESGQGRLKIYLDESKNLVYFKIYSVDEGIIGCNETYDNLRLDEIDMDLIKAQFSSRLPVVDFSSGPNGVRKKKVEFKKKKPAICRCYYAVEFSTDEGYNDLTDTFSYLLEVYAFKENNMMLIDSDSAGEASTKKPKKEESNTSVIIIDDNGDDIEVMEKKEDVNHLIAELQRLIRAGESEKAAFVVRRLARMRLDLEISLSRPDKDATIVENKVTEETIKQPSPPPPQPPKATKLEKCLIYLKTNYDDADEACIHVELEFDVLSTKVSELKEKISDLYGVVAHRQNLIINDCAANDADFLNAYEEFGKRKVNNGFASANAIEEDVYKIYVFINDEQQMSDDAKRELVEDNHEPKRHKVELIEDDDENKNSFAQLAELYNKELNENSEPFACDICLDDAIPPKQGVILKECMHTFCKECLRNHINCCDDPVVKCPFRKDYNCAEHIQEREIRALLNEEEYEKFQMKSLRMSEAAMQNTFHCLTPDCIGFCVSEDNLNFYDCPVCEKVNCLRCNTIHMGKTCKEYQDDLKINAINDKNAKKDKEALEKLISTKKAMYCPGCKIILCKQTGCDWLQCPMCKMEICWATRGPRWGPNGRGDTSGGCKCNLAAGKPCTPNCGNCH